MSIGDLLGLLLVGLMIYHFVTRRGGPFVRYVVSLFVYRPAPRQATTPSVQGVNELPDRSEAFKAPESHVQGSSVQDEPPGMDPPTLQELRQLVQAASHNARGATKQQSIEQAFGVKKGGSAGWRRASQLFDEAMKTEGE
jgi:hypothetical protein